MKLVQWITAIAALTTLQTEAALSPVQGPGLGNLTYTESEVFHPISWVNGSNGIPSTYPFRKDYGTNVAVLSNGYVVIPFAPDSGWGPGGFLIYDVSDPRNIQLVKRIYEPEGRTKDFRESHSIGMANINDKRYLMMQTGVGIELWDFTDINNIRQASKLSLPGVNFGDYTSVSWQLSWQAPYAYISVSNQGVYIVDTTDPENPKIADRGNGQPNPVSTSELGGFRTGPIFVMGNQMVLTSMDVTAGYASLDISDPLNPLLVAKGPEMPKYYATCFDGNKVHTSVRGAGAKMVSFDLTDPNRFVLENNSIVADEQLYCNTQDNFVFQGAQEWLHKIDVSNPASYREVGKGSLHVSHADHGQVTPFGNLIYIGNDHGTGSAFMPHSSNPDQTPPGVNNISPRNGSTNQALTSRIGIAFSDLIDVESLSAQTIRVQTSQGIEVEGTFSVQLGMVNFSPAQDLQPNTEYNIIVMPNGVKDYAGNAIEEQWSSSFTTAAQSTVSGNTAYWPLDDNAEDYAGSNDLAKNGASFSEGGVYLNGSQRLTSEQALNNSLGGTASMSFYIKTNQTGGDKGWNSPGIAGADQSWWWNDVFWGWLDNAGRIHLSTANEWGAASQPINDNQWHHVVLTRNKDSGQLKVYVDGIHQSTGTGVTGHFGTYFNSIGHIHGSNKYLKAGLDDVKIYNRVLTDSDVSNLYNQVKISLAPELTQQAELVDGMIAFDVASSRGGHLLYSWSYGDGTESSYSSDPLSYHSYSQPGHYQVILRVKNGDKVSTYNFVKTINAPLTAVRPIESSLIRQSQGYVYNVNPDNNTVSSIDANSLSKRWEVSVGENPRTLAINSDNDIWVANQKSDSLTRLNSNGSVLQTVSLPYGSQPFAIVVKDDGSLLITLSASNELLKLDANGNELGRIKLAGTLRHIAISSDGHTAYIPRFISGQQQADVYKVDTASMTLIDTIAIAIDDTTQDGEDRGRGIANYLSGLAISPDGSRVWIPSKKDNILRGLARDGETLNFENSVRTIVNQIDLSTDTENFSRQIDFNNRDMANAVQFSPLGDYAFVALQGSNTVQIIDAYNNLQLGAIDNTGLAPQGLALSENGKRLFVYNFTNRSVSAYDISGIIENRDYSPILLSRINTVSNEALSPTVLRGKQVFYNARDIRMSQDGYLSCASCHIDGGEDGQVWDFTERNEGFRNTITLVGRRGMGHGRVHWTANFDEIQDFENDIRNGFSGAGFLTDAQFESTSNPLGNPKAGLSVDLDAMAEYVHSLTDMPKSPYRLSNGELSDSAKRGKIIFAQQDCGSCHSGNDFRDGQKHDVGTIKSTSGLGLGQTLEGVGFDTPTLLGLWTTAPYLHDGSAETLQGVLNNPLHGNSDQLSNTDRDDLVEYLNSLEGRELEYKQLRNDNGACLVARGTGKDANVNMHGCESYTDQFWYEDEIGRLHNKVNPDVCLDNNGMNHNNGWLVVNPCHFGESQRWDWNSTRSLLPRANHNFAVDANGSTDNAQASIWSYHGDTNQRWTMLPEKFVQLKNGDGTCLTASSMNNNASIISVACTQDAKQFWAQDYRNRFHNKANPMKCMDHGGNDWNGGKLLIWDCKWSKNQYFDWDGNILRIRKNHNYVLDKAADGSNKVHVWSRHNGSNQQWSVDGEIN